MRLILQPTMYSCLPACVAMLTGRPITDVYDFVGHDGSDIIYPDEPFPMCHRSFIIPEMIDCLIHWGYYPVSIWDEDSPRFQLRLMLHLQKYNAILLGDSEAHPHACVWCREEKKVFNPIGFKSELVAFPVEYAILLPKVGT
jgi:hypothetical protein